MRNIHDSVTAPHYMKEILINTFIVEQSNFNISKKESSTFCSATSLDQLGNDMDRVAIFRVIKTPVPLSVRLHNKGVNRNNAIALPESISKEIIASILN